VGFTKDGAVFANSRDVAAFFGKMHRHVLDSIGNLIEQEPSLADGGVPTLRQTQYIEPTTGRAYRMNEMDRTGFTLLATGFTGPTAFKRKIRYIEIFDALEA
jgi:Rha family phage regulatory protein